MTHHADIDIDMSNREDILNLIKHIPARIVNKGKTRSHNSGIYIQPIPYDPKTDTSAIHFKDADSRGYFKLDFLNMHVYDLIIDDAHYTNLLEIPPPWHRLAEDDFTKQIVHIGNYSKLVAERMPNSITQMAMLLAAIRPAKAHLQHTAWSTMNKTIWDATPDGKYYFKKAHAISYAVLVALHMNLINGVS